MEIEDIRERLECCNLSPARAQDAIISLLLGIVDGVGGGGGAHTLTTGSNINVPAGAYSVTIQVSTGSVAVNGITILAGGTITLTANNGRTLPEIVVTDLGSAAWTWGAIV